MYLVTGCAGFIGFHTCLALLKKNQKVVGIDNLNNYYDPDLKKARLEQLVAFPNFKFYKIDVSDKAAMENFTKENQEIEFTVHLAAQAGVRYSLENPHAYIDSNVTGQLNMLEMCKQLPNLKHFVYASSSSVYGSNTKMPFCVEDRTDNPISLYAATKKACELMSHAYAHLFKIPSTGLRFFTVYGPWGRPDMAAFIFANAILNNQPVPIFNAGRMRRNFTYVDDIVSGILGSLKHVPVGDLPYAVYNIGNNKSEDLMRFVGVLENHLGKKGQYDLQAMQPGDVKETIADIEATSRDFGFEPKTDIEEGLRYFTDWYKGYYGYN
jgi:UDP-glucuronate 4-epimerase